MNPKTILIADDDCCLVAALTMRCMQLGLRVLVAYDGITALSLILDEEPDLSILDVNMPLGDGLGVCEMLTPDEALSSIPVIILSGCSDDDTIRRCRSLGGHYIFKSTDVWQQVKPLINEILKLEHPEPVVPEVSEQVTPQSPKSPSSDPGLTYSISSMSSPDSHEREMVSKPKTVLIADDDRDLVQILDMRCCQAGLNVVVAYDAISALKLVREEEPDLICLDVNMPSGSGLSVCEMLANDSEFSSIPVIMLTGQTDEDTIRRCHSMCAYYVLKASDIWQRVGPIMRELLGVEQPGIADREVSDKTTQVYPAVDSHELNGPANIC